MEIYEHFTQIGYEYKIEVPTEEINKKIATIRVISLMDNIVRADVSFELRELAKINEKEKTIILSEEDKKTLDSKFNEVFARLNFD